MSLDKTYWSERWEHGQTGWDIGHASRFLIDAAMTFPKESKILIPGCGSGWEAEELFRNGYKQVHVVDIVDVPLMKFKQRVPDFPAEQLICADFFALRGGCHNIEA